MMSKRSVEEEGLCSFFLEKKKKHCKMKIQKGLLFCPHHSHLDSNQANKQSSRIPCPLDSSHFCYESKLHQHLKKCNAREKEKPEYFIQNINVAEPPDAENNTIHLKDVLDEELVQSIQRIKTVYDEINLDPTVHCIALHSIVKAEMEKSDDGVTSFKHMKQIGALASVMEECNFLNSASCFIEFGAGKGQLMYWIAKCVPESHKPAYILVDKASQRYKFDSKYKDCDFQYQRVRMDIQHLYLGKIENISSKLNKVVGVSKHLCGEATDLALKCLMDTLVCEENGEKIKHRALGLVMATCCHHRCSWNSYVGKDFMQKHNISERDFKLMCCLAGWATCGPRKSESDKRNSEAADNLCKDPNLLNRYTKLNLAHEDRTEIGIKCKRLMDVGRMRYLENLEYDVTLVPYVDESVSLENVALVASYKRG